MTNQPKKRNIAFRCPECTDTVFGLIGKFALKADLLRLKCACDKPSAMDIGVASDGKIKLSVPCIFCRQNHSYTVSESAFFERDLLMLSCPYSGMDILFVGDEDSLEGELKRTGEEIERLVASLEADEISDLQPKDMGEDEILPDPAVYDTIRFLVKDLEAEGAVSCPCKEGPYEIRYCDGGVEAYCERCGASFAFHAMTETMAEEYLSIDKIDLK